MSKIKIGDKVSVYGSSLSDKSFHQEKGIVISESAMFVGWVDVKLRASGMVISVHKKQCRKLKPKQKPRQWWLKVWDDGYSGPTIVEYSDNKPEGYGWILVSEVLKK